MTKNWVLSAVIVLSANLAYAVEGNKKASTSPAPLKDPATIEMVQVKGGCYQMGGDTYGDVEPEEKPMHEVCVDDFFIGKYEVTQGQWKKVMGSNPAIDKSCGENCPVDNVSWNDAQDFISKLNSRSGGSKYRLPTEAEFEYAHRSGGKSERYSGGNDVESVGWYGANSGGRGRIHPVGTKAPNGLGIYDMSGNVWEMTNDWYGSEYYSNSPRNNPKGPGSGVERVKKGGGANSPPENLRTSRRGSETPDARHFLIGFRLAKTP